MKFKENLDGLSSNQEVLFGKTHSGRLTIAALGASLGGFTASKPVSTLLHLPSNNQVIFFMNRS